jgi:hypothetical protein
MNQQNRNKILSYGGIIGTHNYKSPSPFSQLMGGGWICLKDSSGYLMAPVAQSMPEPAPAPASVV